MQMNNVFSFQALFSKLLLTIFPKTFKLAVIKPLVLSPMEFWFLAAVASVLLSLGHFISSDIVCDIVVWLHKYYLNRTELDDTITEFNNEMPLPKHLVFNLVILHYWSTIFLFWYCAFALTQLVFLKALYK